MPVMKINKTKKPYYWSKAISYLCKHDPILSNLITQHKSCEALKSTNRPFVTFFKIIVGQQISIEAANAIEGKIKKAIGKITGKKFLSVDTDILRKCGLSFRKIKYIKGIAELVDKDPNFFKKIDSTISKEDIIDGLKLTEYFLNKRVYSQQAKNLSSSRIRLVEHLKNNLITN